MNSLYNSNSIIGSKIQPNINFTTSTFSTILSRNSVTKPTRDQNLVLTICFNSCLQDPTSHL